MLDQVQQRAIDATATGTGVSMMLEHDNVRCVLVVSPQVPRHALSPRELQIARLVADGATNRAIASSLDISLWTVLTHMRRIFAKLGVCSRAEMVAQFFGGGDAGPAPVDRVSAGWPRAEGMGWNRRGACCPGRQHPSRVTSACQSPGQTGPPTR